MFSEAEVSFFPPRLGVAAYSEGFNAYKQAQFQLAFEFIEAVCGLIVVLQNTNVGADFHLILDTNELDTGPLAYMNLSGEGYL